MPTISEHEHHMRRCIDLAREAKDRGNTPVGSLLVLDGRVVAEAVEQLPSGLDPTGHAEVVVIRRATEALGTRDLSGSTLYTTKEPCWMCSYAIRATRVGTAVMGVAAPHVGGATSTYPILLTTSVPHWGPPPEVISGVLEDECARLGKQADQEPGRH